MRRPIGTHLSISGTLGGASPFILLESPPALKNCVVLPFVYLKTGLKRTTRGAYSSMMDALSSTPLVANCNYNRRQRSALMG
jgi:hypothetical protein